MTTPQKSKFVLSLLVALFATCSLLPAGAEEADTNLELLRLKVVERFDMIKAESVNPSPVDGWYTIQQGGILAYISSDARYLFQGDLIDLDQNVNMSDVARNTARRELMATVDDDDVIKFSPANVKYSVSVFTDVECTYCRRLHSHINDYLANGIEVRYLMYPRNGPGSKSWTTAEEVWCSEDRNAALTAAKNDRKFSSTDCKKSIVQQQYEMGHDIGISGTPAIVLQDGTLIPGYMPPDQLKAKLDAASLAQ